MEICSINRRLSKWMQGIIISLMLVLSIIFGATVGNAADQKASATDNTQQSVQVELPEGLYLFQPKIIQMYKYRPEIQDDVFSPLFIVNNGKLLDPYIIANKMGMQKFMKEYVESKTFNVYVGTEKVGKLSKVKLKLFETNACYYEPFSFNIMGSGRYEGKPLPGRYVDMSVYAHNSDEVFLNQSTVKAMAVPQSFKKSKKMGIFAVTEEDKIKAVNEVRKNLISENMKPIEKWVKKERGVILGENVGRKGSRLDFLTAIDLDGNNKKDIIGLYDLSVDYKRKEKGVSQFGNEFLFFLSDKEKPGTIIAGEFGQPAFSLGGVIDIDQDGFQELVVQVSVSLYEPEAEDDEGGKWIEILRHDSSGWKSIYRSMRICDQIN